MTLETLDSFILRPLVLIGILFGLGTWCCWAYKNKKHGEYAIAPMLFSLHALIFFIAGYFNLMSREIYIIWRDLVFINGLIILTATGMVFMKALEEVKQ